VHPHAPDEHADLFLAYDTGSTEVEVLNWLYASVCLLKPRSILETGACQGLGTIALAAACRDNGFGRVHSVEIEPHLCEVATKRVRKEGLSQFTSLYCQDSRNFLLKTNLSFDFGFFDSECEIRVEEFRICRERGILKGVAVFHDTSPNRTLTMKDLPGEPWHSEYRRMIYELAKDPMTTGYFESSLSRGLIALFLK
jgi:predicted O-methyltransferase YrrM